MLPFVLAQFAVFGVLFYLAMNKNRNAQSNRSEAVSSMLGLGEESPVRWDLTDRAALNIGNSRINSLAIHSGRFYGPIKLTVENDDFEVFDWLAPCKSWQKART